MLKLTEIWIYPVKSLGGVRLKSSKVTEKGLLFDRQWMLIDETNTFMTQRLNPRMALFKLSMSDNGFLVQHGTHSIVIPFEGPRQPRFFQATVWDDPVTVCEVDPAISNWFSLQLNTKCRLVYFPSEQARPVDSKFQINAENVSLADGYPFLIVGERSLHHLNSKLECAVPMNRFRPNFIFGGGAPHDEDQWKDFKIGTNRFVGVKPCSRCVLTTIDQETGVAGKEPLATLNTYRKVNNKICFGQNLLAIDHHEIFEGDEITIY